MVIDYLRYKIVERKLRKREEFLYYKNFKEIDRALRKTYRFHNPYRISKRFDSSNPYGETPLRTLEHIGKKCEISSHDSILELGCGRGRGAFFFSQFFCNQVHAIEWNPFFVQKANCIKSAFKLKGIEFHLGNFLEDPLPLTTFIYFYGTTFSDDEITTLCHNIQKRVKIITISYPLTDYDKRIVLLKEFTVLFPWGATRGYLQWMI